MSQVTLEIVESSTTLAVTATNTDVNVIETFTTLSLGNAGPQGIQGIQGELGPANTLTVGTVEGSEPGDLPEIEITGTAPNQTINFVLPTGDTGPQGVAGEVGQVGAVGPVGPKGDTGNTGPAGAVGPTGEVGPAGIQGIQGQVGQTGATGAASTVPGPTGPQGPAGADSTVPGPTGAQGPAGQDSTVPGPQGVQGVPGADSTVPGPEGPTGPAGADSTVPGPQGVQGEPGADSTVPGPQGIEGATGPGVAEGGTAGQVLLKVDGTNFNTTWADNSAEATFYLVRNNTGSTILKGTLVAATGAEPSGRIDVAPFSVTGLQDSELRVMGVATANIANGVNGTVLSFGTLRNIDTRGNFESAIAVGDETWAVGDILFAHPTVAGKLTKVRPQHDLVVAFVTVRNATAGQMAVRITSGDHLEWLHDVSLDYATITNNQVLTYSTATSLWVAQTQQITVNGSAVALGGTITVNARLA